MPPQRGRRNRWREARQRGAVWMLAAAAVLYNAWILEVVVPTYLDSRHSYVSELYAADQPYRWLFGNLELVCAALICVAALVCRDLFGRHAAAGAGWWALAGFGAASVADVLLPMSCAPSVRPDCQPLHPWHTLTSALVHLCLFASLALLSWWSPRHASRPGAAHIAWWGPRLLVCALVSSLLTVGPLLGHPGWHGVPQRAHLLVVGAWLLLLAYAAHTALQAPAPAVRTPVTAHGTVSRVHAPPRSAHDRTATRNR
ncbi:DUF998 domain-containing protein [Streptomyces sp. LX-29]|uniref:DUF998 domain-containing protein n=1 Tax=Streptomyces sp. LX-29 TaxID=2900152 RepID=UPI00240DDD05|nr:DUF998 domain-containing protein [Streptomyces sp. LX-29]WFB06087.1 DUF998 domain-containing protein [Streptomyces sp. LX-29]